MIRFRRDANDGGYHGCEGNSRKEICLPGGLAALSPDFIHLLMGDKWADVAPVISILAVNGYIASVSGYNGNIMLVKGKPHWQMLIASVNALANVVLFMIVGRMA